MQGFRKHVEDIRKRFDMFALLRKYLKRITEYREAFGALASMKWNAARTNVERIQKAFTKRP